MTEKINLIYFSPTGTTKKIVEAIAKGMNPKSISVNDISKNKIQNHIIDDKTLIIVGMPVYRGRIPEIAVRKLEKLKNGNSPAIIIAVYGNREYDDALLELNDIIKDKNYHIIGAAAFIGEHSFSTESKPIAANRPDSDDLKIAEEFGEKIKSRLEEYIKDKKDSKIVLPGNFPYKDNGTPPNFSPVTIDEKCTLCGACKNACPTDAITIEEPVLTDPSKCIWCCACIKVCPTSARIFDNPKIIESTDKLFNNCKERRIPELFI